MSKQVAESVPPQEVTPRAFELTAPLSAVAVHRSIVDYLATRRISIAQNDPQRGVVSSGAVPLTNEQLLAAVPAQARVAIPKGAAGKYFVSFKTTPGEGPGAATSRVVVSVRILALSSKDLDSPLGGRLVPSNGSLEQSFLDELTPRLK